MSTENFDVLIIGAGISGIGAAYYLQNECPDKTYAILEGRASKGGTWDLFRYPGIRSDSDMHTLGFKFKPWIHERAIADGASIMDYLEETAAENAIEQHIRYEQRVVSAAWSTEDASWTVTVAATDGGAPSIYTCNWLQMCSGYYRYSEGYTPEFAGRERFQGTVVHPQHWPENLDYTNKKVVVIGSGATAVTLVPSMAEKAQHVTMLQRSPTYMASAPFKDGIANFLRKILPANWAYNITRWKNILRTLLLYRRTRSHPEQVRKLLLERVQKELGPDYDISTDFSPSYSPWDQRLCLVPDSDFFESLKSGNASIVTDVIETFTEEGIQLKSGQTLEADIIVTATGLNMSLLGDIQFERDGEIIDFAKTWTYRGLMCSDVPNLMITFGYINSSWTLRADLTAEYACRLLNHMQATGTRIVTPRLRAEDQSMEPRFWIADFSSNYMQRALPLFPRQGDHAPWLNTQDYLQDRELLGKAPLEDGVLEFTNPVPTQMQSAA